MRYNGYLSQYSSFIRRRREQGNAFSEIAKELYDRGIRPPFNGPEYKEPSYYCDLETMAAIVRYIEKRRSKALWMWE